jgi:hypothetical protein
MRNLRLCLLRLARTRHNQVRDLLRLEQRISLASQTILDLIHVPGHRGDRIEVRLRKRVVHRRVRHPFAHW